MKIVTKRERERDRIKNMRACLRENERVRKKTGDASFRRIHIRTYIHIYTRIHTHTHVHISFLRFTTVFFGKKATVAKRLLVCKWMILL